MGPTCPFCGRDPFDYVHNGLGLEAVAVTCCELGVEFYRRDRPADITLSREEFDEIGGTLLNLRRQVEAGHCHHIEGQKMTSLTDRDRFSSAVLLIGLALIIATVGLLAGWPWALGAAGAICAFIGWVGLMD